MPRLSRPNRKHLEVTVMFEPHHLQHDLLQTAYAYLVPQPRRPLLRNKVSSVASQAHLQDLRRERIVP
jgi:hypothetical protein